VRLCVRVLNCVWEGGSARIEKFFQLLTLSLLLSVISLVRVKKINQKKIKYEKKTVAHTHNIINKLKKINANKRNEGKNPTKS